MLLNPRLMVTLSPKSKVKKRLGIALSNPHCFIGEGGETSAIRQEPQSDQLDDNVNGGNAIWIEGHVDARLLYDNLNN